MRSEQARERIVGPIRNGQYHAHGFDLNTAITMFNVVIIIMYEFNIYMFR